MDQRELRARKNGRETNPVRFFQRKSRFEMTIGLVGGHDLFELIYDLLVQRHVEQAVDLRALGEVFLA